MAHPGEETSNELFEVLEDWDEQLKHLETGNLNDPHLPEEPQP